MAHRQRRTRPYNLGVVHSHTNQSSDAIAAFRKAAELEPRFVDAWSNLGLAYEDARRYSEAAAAFRKVLEIMPGHAKATAGLNRATAMEQRAAQ